MAGEAVLCLFGLCFYGPYSNLTHPPLPSIPRMDTHPVRTARAKNGSIRDFYSLLLHVLLYHEYPAPASHANINPYGGIGDTDSMCYHQRVVEDINAYGSYRWCDGFSACLFSAIQLQSDVVALSYAHRFGYGRQQ